MEEKKKYPSLPSNYVTLVQLQERWVKEQQKKQIEKERQEQEVEEERRREEQRLINEQDKQKHNEDEKRPEKHSKSITHRRNSRSYDRRTIAVRHLAPEGPEDQPQTEAETKAVVVDGEEIHEQYRNSDESKNWKKKKQRHWRGKPKREEEVTGGAELPAPEKMEEENILVRRDDEEEEKILVRRDDGRKGLHGGLNIWVRRDGERKGMRGGLRYKNKTVVKGKVSEPDDHLTMEIGRKFEDLSINRGKEEGKDRSRVERNGGPWRYRGSGRFSLRGERIRKPRDSGLVWVKKGEICNGNVAGIQYPQQNRRRNQSSLIGIASFAE